MSATNITNIVPPTVQGQTFVITVTHVTVGEVQNCFMNTGNLKMKSSSKYVMKSENISIIFIYFVFCYLYESSLIF